MKVLSVAPRWVFGLVIVAVLAVLIPAKTGLNLTATFKAFLPRETMPSLEQYDEVFRFPMTCENGRFLLKVYYNERGSDARIPEVLAFYLTMEDQKRNRPWVLAVFPTDSHGEPKLYLDTDLDGRVDVVGKPDDATFGGSACDVKADGPRLWYRATPARNAGPVIPTRHDPIPGPPIVG